MAGLLGADSIMEKKKWFKYLAEPDGRIAWSEIESVDLFSVMTRTLEMRGQILVLFLWIRCFFFL